MADNPKQEYPTAQDIDDAINDLTRLYDMRKEYARVKKELDCLEETMHALHNKVYGIMYALMKDRSRDANNKKEGENK